jgi:hypothetical protein
MMGVDGKLGSDPEEEDDQSEGQAVGRLDEVDRAVDSFEERAKPNEPGEPGRDPLRYSLNSARLRLSFW